MKKKLLSFIFALCLIIPCALFVGCTKEKEPTNPPAPEPVNEVKVLLSDDGKTLYRFAPDNDETEYTVPDGVVNISIAAFEGCDNLTKVVLPSSLVNIKEKAFYHCNNLTIVQINSDVYVSKEAFFDCVNLSNIDTSKIVSYGERAFDGCEDLTSITIAKEVTSLPERVFGSWAFANSALSSITFEENSNLERIYDEAFAYNKNLSSINIPASCEYIGAKAFAYTGLTNLTIGKGIDYIGSYAFHFCSNLTNVEFETGRGTADEFNYNCDSVGIFSYCSNLTTVINYPIADIDDECFKRCSKLNSITFGGYYGYTGYIGRESFEACYSLKEFTIPTHITQIKYEAFANCYNLVKLTILENRYIESNNIDIYAFLDCEGLFEIYNLSNMELTKGEGIATYAKDIYTSLDTLSKIKTINNVIYYDNGTDFIALAPSNINITNIEFDSKTTEINQSAFRACESLNSIVLQEGVTKIGGLAFNGCKIASLEIPTTLVEMGYSAFGSTLKTVIINNETISNTCVKYGDNGDILFKATTVYIKNGLTVTNSTYLLENFTKQETSDKTGYDMYVRNVTE